MNAIEIPTADLTHQQWEELRNSTPGIGGSDAAAVLGLDKYRSPLEVWWEKTGRRRDRVENEAMRWGHLLEAVIADEVAERKGWDIYKPGAMFLHPERRWQIANPDRFIDHPLRGRGLLEVKNVGPWQADDWAGENIPDRAFMQATHYCETLDGFDINWWAAAGLLSGHELRITVVEHDRELGRILNDLEERFWVDHVIADVAPPVEGSDSETDFLKALYGLTVYDTVVPLPPEAVDLLGRRWEIDEQLKLLNDERQQIDNQFRAWLELHDIGMLTDGRHVTWKSYPGETFDEEAFAAAQPGVHSEWCTPTVTRRLNFPRKPKPKTRKG